MTARMLLLNIIMIISLDSVTTTYGSAAHGLALPAAKDEGGLSLLAGVATVPHTSIKLFTAWWTNLDEAQPAVFAQ